VDGDGDQLALLTKARGASEGPELMGFGGQLRVRRRFEVHGVVQGVGFRPFVYVTAAELALAGSVANTSAGVVAEVEGSAAAVAEFGRRLRSNPPPLAVIESIHESAASARGGTEFTIDDSSPGAGESRTLASPDIATCDDCLGELGDSTDRRHRHPFITCTNCGPRFTIITDLPYDRATTTMADFDMCQDCRKEYEDPADRRFHAQPIACPDCGPELELLGHGAPTGSVHGTGTGVEKGLLGELALGGELALRGEQALRAARVLLAEGRIVAVKGLGGYHLACDARNDETVAELRRRKQRGGKPFAVMVADLGVARRLVSMTEDEEQLLTGIRRPIVILPRGGSGRFAGGAGRSGGGDHGGSGEDHVADGVAPQNPNLALMLPYTPLHVLLFGLDGDEPGPDALVMTSGNLSGEPIVTQDADALEKLGPFVDAWLRHDRRINVPCDDSVTRMVTAAELPIRRSRGYAPLPIALPFEVGPTLAVGADLKNTCALAKGRYAWISQHIGDMDDLCTVDALTRTERHLELLTGVRPETLVADLHPGYRSSRWARSQADGRPVRTVQHHHAHIASVMGEHGLGAGEKVIGFAFDGTGYGTDGAVWGGEVLVASYRSFFRAAHLGYVPLAGGDASILRPYRMALAHLQAAGVPWDEDLPPVRACPEAERGVLAHQLGTGFGCVPTSSMGRLFDAVASLAGLRQQVNYEGEAAIQLEGEAAIELDGWAAQSARAPVANAPRYAFDIREGGTDEPAIADPGPVMRAVASDVLEGEAISLIALRFHLAVSDLIGNLADRCRERTGLERVALGGGVFQNALLLDTAQHALAERGFTVLRPRLLPPNDGGIALGQILVGASAQPETQQGDRTCV
jgi:hydrogenase maturation protein HypF